MGIGYEIAPQELVERKLSIMPEFVDLLDQPLDSRVVSNFLSNFKSPQLLREDEEIYYEFPTNGVALLADKLGRIRAIYFYSKGRDGMEQFDGRLPAGLEFSDAFANVIKKLGNPTAIR